jgi:hypothetical protein
VVFGLEVEGPVPPYSSDESFFGAIRAAARAPWEVCWESSLREAPRVSVRSGHTWSPGPYLARVACTAALHYVLTEGKDQKKWLVL